MVMPIAPLWVVSEKALDSRPDGIDWLVSMLLDATTFWNGLIMSTLHWALVGGLVSSVLPVAPLWA